MDELLSTHDPDERGSQRDEKDKVPEVPIGDDRPILVAIKLDGIMPAGDLGAFARGISGVLLRPKIDIKEDHRWDIDGEIIYSARHRSILIQAREKNVPNQRPLGPIAEPGPRYVDNDIPESIGFDIRYP